MLVFLIGSGTIGTAALSSGGRGRLGGAGHRRTRGSGRGGERAFVGGIDGGLVRGGGLAAVSRADGRARGDSGTEGGCRHGLLYDAGVSRNRRGDDGAVLVSSAAFDYVSLLLGCLNVRFA